MDDLFNLTVRIERPEVVADAYGGSGQSWAVVGSVRGMLDPVSGSEAFSAHRLEENVTHVFYCRPADIRAGDRLVLPSGERLRVVAVQNPCYAGHHFEVDCELLGG